MGRRTTRERSGRVRIIGGRWRGRRVSFPNIEGLRPTPDRVRETVFNWLSPYIQCARVLDLFAGSGILGLEALSRGASSVVAVESHRVAADQLRESGRQLEADGFEVVVMDVMSYLGATRRRPFDVIFVDPPHSAADYDAICAAVDAGGTAGRGALIYVEFSTPRAPAFSAPDRWTCHRSSRAGHLTYQLWRRVDGPD